MSKALDYRGVILLLMAMAMIIIQLLYPSTMTLFIPSTSIVITMVYLYRKELRNYAWGRVTSTEFLTNSFFAVTHGVIAQAVGIIIVVYGFKLAEPTIPVPITPIILFTSIFVSAIFEEVIYRKIIFSAIDSRFGFWPAALISSLLFAVSHYNYAAYLGYFLLGVVWCIAYKKSNNLGVVIVAHTVFNALYFIVRFLQS